MVEPAGSTRRGLSAGLTVVGLDVGGSKTRARLARPDGTVLAEVEGRGANASALAPAVVEARIRRLLEKLQAHAVDACCAGVAGADTEAGRDAFARLLSDLLPGARVLVVHDARLILAAAGLEAGSVLISGTGAVAYARLGSGHEARAGGWGWLLGDEGSGVWMAREAARELLRRADAQEEEGPLGRELLGAAGVDSAAELGRLLHSRRRPERWAVFARCVFDAAATDTGAAAIVDRAGAALAALAASLPGPGPLVLAGGLLLNQPRLEAAVRRALGDRYAGVGRLPEPPVAGAVTLALELLRPAPRPA